MLLRLDFYQKHATDITIIIIAYPSSIYFIWAIGRSTKAINIVAQWIGICIYIYRRLGAEELNINRVSFGSRKLLYYS